MCRRDCNWIPGAGGSGRGSRWGRYRRLPCAPLAPSNGWRDASWINPCWRRSARKWRAKSVRFPTPAPPPNIAARSARYSPGGHWKNARRPRGVRYENHGTASHRERNLAELEHRSGRTAARRAAPSRLFRRQTRLREGRVRGVRGFSGRQTHQLLPDVCRAGRRAPDPDHRRRGRRWQARSLAGGVPGPRRGAVRLLHPRHGDQRQGVAGPLSGPVGGPGTGGAGRALVPLHRVPEAGGGHTGRIQKEESSPAREVGGGGGAMSGERSNQSRDRGTHLGSGATSSRLVVGRNVRKVDGVKLVTGGAAFTDDVQIPGMLHGKILPSPHAHARIRRIDTTKAKALPGVHAVLTYKDVPRVPHTTAGQAWPEPSPYDTYLLDSKVRFVGDRVAAVAAESRAIAEQALRLIAVDYEILPAVLDMEQAMAPGAAVIHDEPDSTRIYDREHNIAGYILREIGNVEQGFADSDYIVEREFRTQRQQHCPI